MNTESVVTNFFFTTSLLDKNNTFIISFFKRHLLSKNLCENNATQKNISDKNDVNKRLISCSIDTNNLWTHARKYTYLPDLDVCTFVTIPFITIITEWKGNIWMYLTKCYWSWVEIPTVNTTKSTTTTTEASTKPVLTLIQLPFCCDSTTVFTFTVQITVRHREIFDLVVEIDQECHKRNIFSYAIEVCRPPSQPKQ